MKAVQDYINKHHDTIIKFGGLGALFFLAVFAPIYMQIHLQEEIKMHLAIEDQLNSQIVQLDNQLGYYKQSYTKQQAVQQEIQCLAQNIYFEAGAEPHAGKVAVAEVTMNRVKEGFAKTVCGVVNQKNKGVCQFSWVCEPKKPVIKTSEWAESRKIAENILISKKKYSTMQGALFFHADYVKPAWADTKDFVQQVGRHLFYKD